LGHPVGLTDAVVLWIYIAAERTNNR